MGGDVLQVVQLRAVDREPGEGLLRFRAFLASSAYPVFASSYQIRSMLLLCLPVIRHNPPRLQRMPHGVQQVAASLRALGSGKVQRRGGFVEQDDLGVGGQRARGDDLCHFTSIYSRAANIVNGTCGLHGEFGGVSDIFIVKFFTCKEFFRFDSVGDDGGDCSQCNDCRFDGISPQVKNNRDVYQ